jgi:hypothetical protein
MGKYYKRKTGDICCTVPDIYYSAAMAPAAAALG